MNGPTSLIRHKLYELSEVFPFVDDGAASNVDEAPLNGRRRPKRRNRVRRSFDGRLVWMTSPRLLTFKEKGVKCVTCGLEGKYFALEQHTNINSINSPDAWHFNLYALNEANEEVLMTRDHILPKSCGGRDGLENSQTMCAICNNKKGNKVST